MGEYDTVTKHLIEAHPRDWLLLAGLPTGTAIEAVDANLSTVSPVPDKLFRVTGAGRPTMVHIEFQAGRDPALDWRVFVYNVLARWKYGVPVQSAVFLLRPSAAGPTVRGQVREGSAAHTRLAFDYRLVRVWELPVAPLLSGGLGTLPLAPIAAVAPGQLPAVVDHIRARLDREVPAEEAGSWWTAIKMVMTVRYRRPQVEALLKGVRNMKESWFYQDILKEGQVEGRSVGLAEGRVEGRVEGERRLLLRMGAQKFGPADPGIVAKLDAIYDPAELERLGIALLAADTWEQLLGNPTAKPRRKRRS